MMIPSQFPPLLPISIFHTLFFLVMLFTKKKPKLYDYIAAVWVIFICLACIRRSLHIAYGPDSDIFFLKFLHYPLAYGPCLYLYVRILVRGESKFKYKDLLHFIPLLIVIFTSAIPNLSFESFRIDDFSFTNGNTIFLALYFAIPSLASLSIYTFLALKLLKKHRETVYDHYSYESIEVTVSWLTKLTILFFVFLNLQSGLLVYSSIFPPKFISYKINGSIIAGYLYLLSYFLLRQNTSFPSQETSPPPTEKKEKYAKSGLSIEKREEIISSLLEYMKKEKPFLQNELDVERIAKAMNISVNHLSQCLNVGLSKNFFMFINDYRVDEVIARFQDPNFNDYNILRIALDSGFNSKSSFNSIFRKATGFTPMEYREKLNKEVALK
ncbi:helix-turn-helix domain-containing protein [Leptospira ilyithenensis]|uniref:AraC family transcriptional regulator n=1 Tax=Leptospira ilyithenensis TaxID=2484901 RepID=A0A4R9LVG6_9LEPT|nr:AraC family transcriptional regulator [Leptospira ilyithenensis]TGN13423.1 AraC family transcriptional regulator [Leptospira ilyithenensis]